MSDVERHFFRVAVLTYAGPLAQARAGRKSEQGWVRLLSPERTRAIHEAAHGIAAAAVGQFVHQLSIVPNPERCFPDGKSYSGGFCTSSDREDDTREPSPELTRDRTAIVRAAWALTLFENVPAPRWKAVRGMVRVFRRTAERILDAHWLLVLDLASELERHKTMERSQIERFTQRIRATVADAKIPLGGDSRPAQAALLCSGEPPVKAGLATL